MFLALIRVISFSNHFNLFLQLIHICARIPIETTNIDSLIGEYEVSLVLSDAVAKDPSKQLYERIW